MEPERHPPNQPQVRAKGGLFPQPFGIVRRAAQTCKLNGIDPQAYLVDILARIARGHTINLVDRLLPWNWKTGQVG